MRGLFCVTVLASCLFRAALAVAQPEPEAEAEPAAAADTAPEPDRERTDPAAAPAAESVQTERESSAASAEASASSKASDLPEAQAAPEAEPAPALPPAQASDQRPYPYLKEPPPDAPSRNVDLGPDAGIWWRPAAGDTKVDYSPGFAWGAHARLALVDWLGLRALVTAASLPVSVERGGLGPTASTEVDQPDVQIILLGLRLEPTWVVTPRLRLWTGLGTGWASVEAPAPEARGEDIRSARRTGVLIDLSAALGATFDVIPNWMTATLELSGGLIANQSGDVFKPVQAFAQDPPAQSISHYDGLPEFAGSLSALTSVGLIL